MAEDGAESLEDKVKALEKLVKDQSNVILALQADAAGKKDKDEDEGPWVPHYPRTNPHAQRPPTANDKPQLYDLTHSPTYAILEQKVTAFRYEYRTLEPSLSYLFDLKTLFEATLPYLSKTLTEKRSRPSEDDLNPSAADLEVDDTAWALLAMQSTLKDTYKLLAQRADYIRLKTRFDSQQGGITIGEKAFLQHLETKFYGMADGLSIVDSDVSKWTKEFGDKTATARLTVSAKLAAGRAKGKGDKGKGRDGKGGQKGGKGE